MAAASDCFSSEEEVGIIEEGLGSMDLNFFLVVVRAKAEKVERLVQED